MKSIIKNYSKGLILFSMEVIEKCLYNPPEYKLNSIILNSIEGSFELLVFN